MSKVSIHLVVVNSLSHELFMEINIVVISYSAVCKRIRCRYVYMQVDGIIGAIYTV